MKYAVLKTGGKQYRVSEGQILEIERILGKPKDTVEFSQVLLQVDEGEKKLGAPFLEGTKVTAELLGQIRGEKIRVSKFKAKVRYRKTIGHRQELTRVKILRIGENTKQPEKKESDKKPQVTKKLRKKPKA